MPAHPIVETDAGIFAGRRDGDVLSFRGIPYAAPPVGELRWRPPVRLARLDEIQDAAGFGPACWQRPPTPGSVYGQIFEAMDEDCLTLNIWAKEGLADAPVYVWIHGGALATGGSGDPMLDGAAMAQRGVVVVTINYRLGVFGFLAHPELSAENSDAVSGNYGLLDQIEALKWISWNIMAFGGDPNNITIAGESAGALSVLFLMASPAARGLFHRAIAQSAYMISMPSLRGRRHGHEPAEDIGAALMRALHCRSIADMRAIDAGALTSAAFAAGYAPWPTIDGGVVPGQLVDIFERGEQALVPLLAGFNRGEILSIRFLVPAAPDSATAYESMIRARYGDLADAFLQLYPACDLEQSMTDATRDAMYGWTAFNVVARQRAAGQPAFLYFFDHSTAAARKRGLHAFHASEIPYVFGTLADTPSNWPQIPATPLERKLSEQMMDYWASFARCGKPEAAGAPTWSPYDDSGFYMAFEAGSHPRHGLLPDMYALHDEIVRRRRANGKLPWNWNTGIAAPKSG
ncbi:carboxylesterase/lipase family protein [Sphingomonas sp. Root710]|uniref:carboxylesterase/lipase family protein n=1 Tax=Sphingomonas sp. Root710 TaxID=1736594 RepID=UPI0019108F0E|nr:carboxylesterase family protein [Sphingomonas sp. Root710]